MKKTILMATVAILAVFAIGFAASYDSSSSDSKKSCVGIYKGTDKLGLAFTIKVNEDETATIEFEKGIETFYGSWDYYNSDGYVQLNFIGSAPSFCFKELEAEMALLPCIKDGWLYVNSSALNAKNPEGRIALKKIK